MRLRLPLLAPALLAFDYGVPVRIASEADLYEMEAAGELDEAERDQLLDLLEDPLDPNRASREALHLLPGVTWAMADAVLERRKERPFTDLGGLGAVLGDRVLAECRPFLREPSVRRAGPRPKGQVVARAMERHGDGRPPVAYTRARVGVGPVWEGGLLVAEEVAPVGVSYESVPILVEGTAPVTSLERAWLAADWGWWSFVAGHYQAGFGEGLTFDVTDQRRPYGFRPDLSIREDTAKYDSYSLPRRLLGAAGRASLPLGSGARAELVAFVSSSPTDLYFTTFEPHDWVAPILEEVEYPTFPAVFREDLGGLHASVSWGPRLRAGATAWTGHAERAFDFDFTNVPIPNRERYGAAGADLAAGRGMFDLFGEVAFTDSGGAAGRAEVVASPGATEVSLAWRDYGTAFDNPHSRSRSEPDWYSRTELEDGTVDPGGKLDRDEVGPQVQVVTEPTGWLGIRLDADVWRRPSLDVTHSHAEGRLSLDPVDAVSFDLMASRRDKDVTLGGRGLPYEASDPLDEKGEKRSLGGLLRVRPAGPIELSGLYKHGWTDVDDDPYAFEQGHYWWVAASWEVVDEVEVGGRFKTSTFWESDPWSDCTQSWTADLRARLPARVTVTLRYVRVAWDSGAVPPVGEGPGGVEHLARAGVDWRI